mmetsp:Transcript_5839/g.16120  ORF Transcript_5839/g.16120 Transcript_5839/m.16120 type:complete len:565 (+) Transcript_5839:44-1738(+)
MAFVELLTTRMHLTAIRLCGLIFFFAFLGNSVDGPIMWLLTPPSGGYTAADLVWLNRIALIPALIVVLRPRWWPALALCWCIWRSTYLNGGLWFFDGWDTMLLEVGFLAGLLAITLTLFDAEVVDVADDWKRDARRKLLTVPPGIGPDGFELETAETRAWRKAWDQLWGVVPVATETMVPCSAIVGWCRTLAELSLTLMAFRLFFAAGLEKLRVGDPCWKDLTCLYDFYEMQPGPTALAWYFHTYTPHVVMSIMQFFAINVSECLAPVLLLSPMFSVGAKCESRFFGSPAAFRVRLLGAAVIIIFVTGIFVCGNFAFLHPLSVVPLVASMGLTRGTLMAKPQPPGAGILSRAKAWYRRVAPVMVLVLLAFAFLPSLRAYAWILRGSEDTGRLLRPVMDSRVVQAAADLSLGIPYQRHEYFARPLHTRNDMVLSAQVGDEWVELDIPQKVGHPNRSPRQTSPLHRRFAWQWWFLPLGSNGVVGKAAAPGWLRSFMRRLCEGHSTAWSAVESSPAHSRLHEVRRVAVQMYSYHFAAPGTGMWWTRRSHGNVSWPLLGTTHLEIGCD